MNTQTKVTGVLATLFVFGAAPIPSYAVTAERNGSFQPAVQPGGDTSDLLVAAAQRGGGGARGGGGRSAGGGNRGGGGGAAAANRGGGGGAAAANRSGGGQRQVRSQATSNVNHRAGNANVNNNRSNINSGNRNINNVNVAGDFDGGGWNGGWDDDYHPFAAAAVVGGTAAIVGSMVNSVPPSCTPVVVNGATYSQCGSTWYQPQYAGTSVQYEVVNPPQ